MQHRPGLQQALKSTMPVHVRTSSRSRRCASFAWTARIDMSGLSGMPWCVWRVPPALDHHHLPVPRHPIHILRHVQLPLERHSRRPRPVVAWKRSCCSRSRSRSSPEGQLLRPAARNLRQGASSRSRAHLSPLSVVLDSFILTRIYLGHDARQSARSGRLWSNLQNHEVSIAEPARKEGYLGERGGPTDATCPSRTNSDVRGLDSLPPHWPCKSHLAGSDLVYPVPIPVLLGEEGLPGLWANLSPELESLVCDLQGELVGSRRQEHGSVRACPSTRTLANTRLTVSPISPPSVCASGAG